MLTGHTRAGGRKRQGDRGMEGVLAKTGTGRRRGQEREQGRCAHGVQREGRRGLSPDRSVAGAHACARERTAGTLLKF